MREKWKMVAQRLEVTSQSDFSQVNDYAHSLEILFFQENFIFHVLEEHSHFK